MNNVFMNFKNSKISNPHLIISNPYLIFQIK